MKNFFDERFNYWVCDFVLCARIAAEKELPLVVSRRSIRLTPLINIRVRSACANMQQFSVHVIVHFVRFQMQNASRIRCWRVRDEVFSRWINDAAACGIWLNCFLIQTHWWAALSLLKIDEISMICVDLWGKLAGL